MNVKIILLFITAIAIFAVFIVFFRQEDKSAGSGDFDERQIAMRGSAYKAGFLTAVIVSMLAAGVVCASESFQQYAVSFITLPVLAGGAVFAFRAIFTDAYVGGSTLPGRWLALNLVIGASNLIVVFTDDDWTDPAVLLGSSLTLSLLFGIYFTLIALMMLIKTAVSRREEE